MINLELILILVLATYGISRLIAKDSLFQEIKWRLQDKTYLYDEEGEPQDYLPLFTKNGKPNKVMTQLRGKLVDGLFCMHCNSAWIGLGLYEAWSHNVTYAKFWITILAIRGAVSIVVSLTTRLDK